MKKAKLENFIKSLIQDKQVLQKEIEMMGVELDDSKKDIEKLKMRNMDLSNSYSQIFAQKEALDKRISTFEDQRKKLAKGAEENEKILHDRHNEIKDLKKECQDLHFKNDTVQAEKEAALQLSKEINGELKERDLTISEKNKDITQLQDKNTQLNAKILTLEAQNNEYERQINAGDDKSTPLEKMSFWGVKEDEKQTVSTTEEPEKITIDVDNKKDLVEIKPQNKRKKLTRTVLREVYFSFYDHITKNDELRSACKKYYNYQYSRINEVPTSILDAIMGGFDHNKTEEGPEYFKSQMGLVPSDTREESLKSVYFAFYDQIVDDFQRSGSKDLWSYDLVKDLPVPTNLEEALQPLPF